MKLLLVDDNALYLQGLIDFLQLNGFEVLGTAANGLEALAKVEMLQPDMILMDVQMDNYNGIEATCIIKRDFPEIEIVMLSISESDEHLFEAIRAGASGYLLKNMEAKGFLAELRRLAADETPLAPGLGRRILREFAQTKQDAKQELDRDKLAVHEISALTERQKAVLKLLAQGLTYKEIGEDLNIQEITVKYHVNEILKKLHLANRTQLIAHACRLKMQ